jgi:hypothetical protein
LPIWNFCAVSMFLQVMQHLSPQPLHCPISGLLVDMSALIKRSFRLLCYIKCKLDLPLSRHILSYSHTEYRSVAKTQNQNY